MQKISNLYVSSEYKSKIIDLLCKNDNFISLINPALNEYTELNTADVLLGGEWIINGVKHIEQGHIFDYDFTDNTISGKKTFVFVETDIETIDNNMFTDFNLYVCIHC